MFRQSKSHCAIRRVFQDSWSPRGCNGAMLRKMVRTVASADADEFGQSAIGFDWEFVIWEFGFFPLGFILPAMALSMRWVGEADRQRVADARAKCYGGAINAFENYAERLREDRRGVDGDFLLAERDGAAVGTAT